MVTCGTSGPQRTCGSHRAAQVRGVDGAPAQTSPVPIVLTQSPAQVQGGSTHVQRVFITVEEAREDVPLREGVGVGGEECTAQLAWRPGLALTLSPALPIGPVSSSGTW